MIIVSDNGEVNEFPDWREALTYYLEEFGLLEDVDGDKVSIVLDPDLGMNISGRVALELYFNEDGTMQMVITNDEN